MATLSLDLTRTVVTAAMSVQLGVVPGQGRTVAPKILTHASSLGAFSPQAASSTWTTLEFRSLGVTSLAAFAATQGRAARRRRRATRVMATATATATAEKWFAEQAERSSPSKLAERGLKVLNQLQAPEKNQEPFRYTDLDALLYSVPVTPEKGEFNLAEKLPPLLEETEAYRMVFVDGQLHAGFSRLPAEDAALVGGQEALESWSAEARSHFSQLMEQLPEVDFFQSNKRDMLGCGKLAALNQAVFRDVAYVSLPEAKNCEDMTLEMVFVSTGCTAPRMLLHVGSGRSLKVIESHLSLDESDAGLCNGLCRVVADEDAQVRHEVLQLKSDSARFVESIMAEVASGALYQLRCVQSGASCARVNVAVALQGEKASCDVKAVMLADEKQQLDLHSLIHHSVPSCRSNQEHKNLVGGSAECIFKGIIKVDAEAQQTESAQIVRSLLLTKKSKVKAMPSLQIQADEVTCSHGAALTQLDPEELFYLASRGLDAANARRLMLSGFPMDLLEGLKELMPKSYARVTQKLTSMAESNAE